MLACQEMEARQDEQKPTSVDSKPEAAEDAVVNPVKGWKKWYSGKKQAAERCEEPE
jgi:hypothetical protein